MQHSGKRTLTSIRNSPESNSCLLLPDPGRRSVHSAYLTIASNEMVSERGARRGLGFDGVYGEAVRYELNQCRPVAGN